VKISLSSQAGGVNQKVLKLRHFIIDLARKANLRPEKYLRAGHNGPYNDPETPARVFGHWLITFAKCYEWTGEKRFKNRVAELASYLCSEEVRPYGYSFHHRNNPKKDRCNGLIGQAWTFEALAEASALLTDERYAELAEEVFLQHPFDHKLGLWKCLDIDGRILHFDVTFNHQLWFAACGLSIQSKRRGEIVNRITRFLDCLEDNLTMLEGGLIYHPIENLLKSDVESKSTFSTWMKEQVRLLLVGMKAHQRSEREECEKQVREQTEKKFLVKSIGYHCFNLYALAMLKEGLLNHPFWNSNIVENMVDYVLTKEYLEGIQSNPFGFPYNPPGFEVPYALSVLKRMPPENIMKTCSWWVGEQLRRCFNSQTQLMDRNTKDPLTHTARIYEIVRLNDSLLGEIRGI